MRCFLLAGLLLVLAGCQPAPSAPGAETERVVSLAPSMTELMYAAGAGRHLVAVTRSDDYPPAVDTLERFDSYPLDLEALIALAPTRVLATSQINTPTLASELGDFDIQVDSYTFSSLGDIFSVLVALGDTFGTPAQARASVENLEGRLANLDSVRASFDSTPRVLVLVGDSVLYAFGGESYVNEMVERAGGQSVTGELPGESAILSEEFVLQEAPDVILIGSRDRYDPSRLLRLHPTWDIVPAVRDGHVYGVSPDYLYRPGPRVVDGIAAMQQLLVESGLAGSALTDGLFP
ncbi:MAG: ABC transporter substrate-binding protein [Bacteroidota bacterium]